MDDAGGLEDWKYQNDMLKEQVKALIDSHLLKSIDYELDPDVEGKQVLTITLLPIDPS